MNSKKINCSILYFLVAMSLMLMACQNKPQTASHQEEAIEHNDTSVFASDEMPNLIAMYTTYHEQGLGIIGISLDSDYNKWKNTVETMNMPWLQLSELRGWDSYVAKQFSVNAIPYTIIANKKGIILKKGLRGEELEQFVSSYLKDTSKK